MAAEMKTSKFQLDMDQFCSTRIPGLSSAMKTSTIQLDVDHFLFYTKSRVALFIGTLVKPLVSNGEIIVNAEEKCKIKISFDLIELSRMKDVNRLEFIIRNNYEERTLNGNLVKQFSAVTVSDYINDRSDSLSRSF